MGKNSEPKQLGNNQNYGCMVVWGLTMHGSKQYINSRYAHFKVAMHGR